MFFSSFTEHSSKEIMQIVFLLQFENPSTFVFVFTNTNLEIHTTLSLYIKERNMHKHILRNNVQSFVFLLVCLAWFRYRWNDDFERKCQILAI